MRDRSTAAAICTFRTSRGARARADLHRVNRLHALAAHHRLQLPGFTPHARAQRRVARGPRPGMRAARTARMSRILVPLLAGALLACGSPRAAAPDAAGSGAV